MAVDKLIRAFEYGVDYGLLLAEKERDSEELYDAMQCGIFAKEMCMPSTPAERRQAHGSEWREAMKNNVAKFLKLCEEVTGNA